MNAPGPVRLTVAVPTFRRPAVLARLLPALLAQLDGLHLADGSTQRLLVIDNDPAQSARPALSGLPDDRLHYLAEGRPGVVAVRNRALREAETDDVLVFLDDDQEPTPGWLAALVETWRTSAAAGVAGPVRSRLPDEAPRWLREGGFFDRAYRASLRTGDRLEEVATTNLLLDLPSVRRLDLSFDERFGLSGGEDSLFTRRLASGTGGLVWCAEAAVVEAVPPSRLSRRWVYRRAVSSGNTTARVALALSTGSRQRVVRRAELLASGTARLLAGGAGLAVGTLVRSAPRRGRATRAALRGGGMLLGAVDVGYLEYARGGSRWVRQSVGPARPNSVTRGADQ